MIRRTILPLCIVALLLVSAGCITAPWKGETTVFDGTTAPGSAGSGIFSEESRYQFPTVVPTAARDMPGYAEGDQKIISTAAVTLEVANVTATLDPLKSIAAAHGGYLGSLSSGSRYGDREYAVVMIRVPAGEFDPTLREIKGLGALRSETMSADDVTEEYVDLQARRAALAGQLAQYNRIMEQAVNVSDVLEVQVQIERVQVELDRIDGRIRYLDSRVDFGTITVSLEEPEPVGGGEGFSAVSVINEGITGFLAVAAGIVIVLISIVPLVILGIIGYLAYRWWKGRKGKK